MKNKDKKNKNKKKYKLDWRNVGYFSRAYKGLPFFHPKNLKSLFSMHEDRKDRSCQGWCPMDAWEFVGWFQAVIPEMLEYLANNHYGYNMIDFEKTRETGKRVVLKDIPESGSFEEEQQIIEYEDYLKEIAQHIRNSNEERVSETLDKEFGDFCFLNEENKKKYFERYDELNEKSQEEIEKAFDMLKPIFFDLWD